MDCGHGGFGFSVWSVCVGHTGDIIIGEKKRLNALLII